MHRLFNVVVASSRKSDCNSKLFLYQLFLYEQPDPLRSTKWRRHQNNQTG